jgi:hypothetical protein
MRGRPVVGRRENLGNKETEKKEGRKEGCFLLDSRVELWKMRGNDEYSYQFRFKYHSTTTGSAAL